ncbi:formate/nitrite transporter family protein [Serratia fonticola]|uniref:Formate/nitrite transporter family protein n=2 Tax=Serratia TaxID=613 RepID=A0AAW3WIP2_SERFO|nr:formate/nitrite transporter family protein [Serratia fonticola]MBC3210613.1 formate/nitrite transporter family protein [Serratia fonticola]NYA11595.1 formate/nitrite transporter family protein [Serratia fonticola]NYA32843.1 formate/nitrite transporter family protein [Serratia fonticola]
MSTKPDRPANSDENSVKVESEEHDRGKSTIEVDEEKLPSRAAAVHEQIRMEGEKELERDWLALLLSALAAGLSMGASLAAKGIFHARLPDDPSRFFIENLGYTFGFIIVIMARQQLFTENTVTAVLPIMHKPTPKNFVILFRLWGIVLLGNLLGTGLAALAFIYMPIFDENTRAAFTSLSQEIMHNTPGEMFANGILAGWIIATMVWMFPSARAAKIWVIVLMTYLVAICDLTHIVVGSVEILYLVFSGALPWQEFFYPFAIPTLAGNIIGGSFIFALISHAQIRNDMSDKAKAERLKAQRENQSRKEHTDKSDRE